MRIRWKLLIVLLTIALLPLGFMRWLEYRSLKRLGHELGSRAREALIERAGHQLLQLAEDYGNAIRRETETLELVLRVQAREVERCLAAEPPESPEVFWAEDYDRGENLPDGMLLSDKHFRTTAGGQGEPVPITYEQQVFKLAPGVNARELADDIARISLMPAAYRFLRRGHPAFIHWQYTALAGGIHTSYPGHGGYPEAFDPRQRTWYRNALDADDLTWNPPMVDASTRAVMLSLSMPVRCPDGSPAGVTGIDLELLDVVQGVNVPAAWSSDAQVLVVLPERRPGRDTTGLLILAQQSYLREGQAWNVPIELEWLESADQSELRGLLDDIRAHRSGLRKMPYHGRDSLWAYASADQDAYLLLVVPYEEIIAQAVAVEADLLRRTRQQLRTAGITLVVVSVVVFLLALFGSRTVTRPVTELANAARRIAGGDLTARASVKTRDELGELGQAFNDMVPQLAERIHLRQSLALAMEVQQHLLPADPPKIEGLDIAGRSIYCDETGGDYYDFVDLSQLSPRTLGVAVGDVTGHGIAAALLMATGRALLRSRADQPGGLGALLSHMNHHLAADVLAGKFMTLCFLLFDTKDNSVRWASAGHDPAIVYTPARGSFSELAGGGIPLGIEPGWQFKELGPQKLEPGQVIVIGTDGVWETRNPQDQMFGKERVREIMRATATRSAREISAAITDAIAAFRGSRFQDDDVTLVVVKVEAASQAGNPDGPARNRDA